LIARNITNTGFSGVMACPLRDEVDGCSQFLVAGANRRAARVLRALVDDQSRVLGSGARVLANLVKHEVQATMVSRRRSFR